MSILEGLSGWMVWRQSKRAKIEMVWTCAEERCWLYWERDAEDGAARQEEKRRTKEEVYG